MKDTKIMYTMDGKKVGILHPVKDSYFWVKEVFVSSINGKEFLGGDPFIANNLLPEPAVSWEQIEKNKLREELEEFRKDCEKEVDFLIDQLKQKRIITSNKVKAFEAIFDNVDKTSFETLLNFLSGEIKYIVIPEILYFGKFEDYISENDGLKLLSLFGMDKGDLKWVIHGYSDGSGSRLEVIPFKNREDALKRWTQAANARGGDFLTVLKKAKELGVTLSKTFLDRAARLGLSSIGAAEVRYKMALHKEESKKKELVSYLELASNGWVTPDKTDAPG